MHVFLIVCCLWAAAAIIVMDSFMTYLAAARIKSHMFSYAMVVITAPRLVFLVLTIKYLHWYSCYRERKLLKTRAHLSELPSSQQLLSHIDEEIQELRDRRKAAEEAMKES